MQMEDDQIVKLFEARDQKAIKQVEEKYKGLIHMVIKNVLSSDEDISECVNDTYLGLWNSIPPNKPESLPAYISRVAKNISINRFRDSKRQKRSAEMIALDELDNILPGKGLDDELSARALKEDINHFLGECTKIDRVVFVSRFWYGTSVSELAEKLHSTQNAISSRLSRLKKELKQHLIEEGYEYEQK